MEFRPEDQDCKNVEYIVSTLHELMPEHMGVEVVNNQGQPHEANFLKLDCSKAKTHLKWNPKFNVDKALEFTVSWYQSLFAGENLRSKSLEQIHAYQDKR